MSSKSSPPRRARVTLPLPLEPSLSHVKLLDLANETLAAIASYLPDSDLNRFSMVSQRLFEVTRPARFAECGLYSSKNLTHMVDNIHHFTLHLRHLGILVDFTESPPSPHLCLIAAMPLQLTSLALELLNDVFPAWLSRKLSQIPTISHLYLSSRIGSFEDPHFKLAEALPRLSHLTVYPFEPYLNLKPAFANLKLAEFDVLAVCGEDDKDDSAISIVNNSRNSLRAMTIPPKWADKLQDILIQTVSWLDRS